MSARGDELLSKARDAAELRRYRTDPDVAALAIERVRTAVGVLTWIGIVLGLAFTASNVAMFAARGAAPGSIQWVIAWLLDPMVSLCLLAVLLAEATLARYQINAGGWVFGAKWGLLGATLTMNTWSAVAGGDPALIVLHTVPVAVVFVMAEASTGLRHRLTDAVEKAHRYATHAATQRAAAERLTDEDATGGPADCVIDTHTEPRVITASTDGHPRAERRPRRAAAPWTGTKTEELRRLVAAEVDPTDPRTASELARQFAPRVGVHPTTARKAIQEVRTGRRDATAAGTREVTEEQGRVVQLTSRGGQ